MMVSSLRFAVLMVAALATSVSQAEQIFFNSSFTTAEGFADGGIGFGGANPDTIVGQSGFSITNSSGAGTLNGGQNFNRALFGWNSGMDENFVNNTASEIRISATGLVFNPVSNNVANFGLANVATTADNQSGALGSSKLAGGVKFSWNAGQDRLYINNLNPSGFSQNTNTNIASGESFDYEQRWLGLGGGAFDIQHYFNGSLLATTFNVTPNFDLSGTQVTGFVQDADANAGAYSMDSLRLSAFSAVPEPSSLGLFTVGIAAFAGRRRRR